MSDAENGARARAWAEQALANPPRCGYCYELPYPCPQCLRNACTGALAAAVKAKGEAIRDELQVALCHPSTFDRSETPLDEYGKRVLRAAIRMVSDHAADIPEVP